MRTVLVSDLHVGGGPGTAERFGGGFADGFDDDEAFAELLLQQRGRGPFRLVLLGDTFDFLHVPVTDARVGLYARSDEEAVGQLRCVAAAHPTLVDALAATVAAGCQVDVVVGNHDVELARPAVQRELARLLAGTVAVHPFVLHLPGVLHAQHGHHHHDINTLRNPLAPVGSRGVAERPPAARLHGALAVLRRPGVFGREVPTVLLPRWSDRPRPPDGAGLPPAAVEELLGLGSTSLRRIAVRLLRRVPGRHGGAAPPYGAVAAQRVLAVLERHGCGVPFVVFGHTHDAQVRPLPDGGWYLNTGTWSCDARGADGARLTWVEVEDGVAALWRWSGGPELLASTAVSTAA